MAAQYRAAEGFGALVADGVMAPGEALAALKVAAAKAAPEMDEFGRNFRVARRLRDAVVAAEARRDGNWAALRRAAWAAGEAGGDEGAWRAAIADAAGALEPLPPIAWLDDALAVARRARAARRWRR